jgi:adenylate cyclase
VADVQLAIRLSPRDPAIGSWHATLGDAELALGHFDAAIDEYHKSIDLGWRAIQPYSGLAAAYALQGRMADAQSALAEARRINPNITVKWLIVHERPSLSYCVSNLLIGLHKAGLPYE